MWRRKRNLENSLLKYIKDNINSDWSGINIGLSFSYNDNNLPFIAIRIDSAVHSKLELGTNILRDTDLAIIDIYATSDGQRLDLSQYLLDKLKDGFIYYEFSPNSNDPDNPTKISKGNIYVGFESDVKVDLGENVNLYDRYRHRITINLETNKV